jgi:uncharacterized membrane protein
MDGGTIVILHACIVAATAALALAMRPWRAIGPGGPPWGWLAMAALLPLLWGLDRHAAVRVLPALSGASLLVLMAGWPLAVLAMLPATLVTGFASDLSGAEALHRLVWLGLAPATLAVALGAALRRWLPNHLFVYILGRGFLGTVAVVVAADAISWLVQPAAADDPLVARVLAAFGEAFLTGMATAILVAFRPDWLATYADRLYLPPPPSP